MTGMKEGAGEDPFADDEDDEPENETTRRTTSVRESETIGGSAERSGDRGGESHGHTSSSVQIPYKFRRDGVQDGRDRVPLFLQEGTKTDERNALRELEDHFDENVSLTDLREAVVMVGLSHLDEVKLNLEEWGYGMKFE